MQKYKPFYSCLYLGMGFVCFIHACFSRCLGFLGMVMVKQYLTSALYFLILEFSYCINNFLTSYFFRITFLTIILLDTSHSVVSYYFTCTWCFLMFKIPYGIYIIFTLPTSFLLLSYHRIIWCSIFIVMQLHLKVPIINKWSCISPNLHCETTGKDKRFYVLLV